jgi:hypothetical protein
MNQWADTQHTVKYLNAGIVHGQEVSKEVVGSRVLLTHSLFGDDILRRLPRRGSAAKSTSAPLRF